MTINRLILDMPAEQYHASPAISKSGLDQFRRSPMHYKWSRENQRPDADHFRVGRAFHTLILEPEKAAEYVAIAPERWPTKAECGRTIEEQKAEWTALQGERAIIKPHEFDTLKAMSQAIVQHPAARMVLEGKGKIEASLFWTDPETGVECRCRPDWMRDDGLLVDLKSARDASPDWFTKDAWNHHYHLQAAMYCEGFKQVTGKDAAGFVFIAVDKDAPHGVSVRHSMPEFLAAGLHEYRRLMAEFSECQKADKWPGYPDTIEPLSPPEWVMKRLEQQGVFL